MVVLITIISVINFLLGLAVFCAVMAYRKDYDLIQQLKAKDKPTATDNFQKPKEIYQSTSHIIVPKTPTEIRNQNFQKIKDGATYGEIKKD